MKLSWVAALALAVACASCATPARITRESSAPVRPAWIAHPPQGAQEVYFIGLCSGAESLEAGQRTAIDDALAQVSRFIGVKIEVASSSYLDEVRQDITSQIRSHSAAKMRGYSTADWYYEKITRIDKSFSLTKYDVYVLLRYDRGTAEAERRRQAAENSSEASIALKRFEQAQAAAERGQIWRAARLYAQTRKILGGLDASLPLPANAFKNTAELAAAAEDRSLRNLELLHRYAYRVEISAPPGASQAFRAAFMAALSQGGYSTADASPAFIISGRVSLIRGGIALNNQVYSAQGQVSAIRAEDHYEAANIEVMAKGLHRDPLQASINAAEEAGRQSGQDLMTALSEAEVKKLQGAAD